MTTTADLHAFTNGRVSPNRCEKIVTAHSVRKCPKLQCMLGDHPFHAAGWLKEAWVRQVERITSQHGYAFFNQPLSLRFSYQRHSSPNPSAENVVDFRIKLRAHIKLLFCQLEV